MAVNSLTSLPTLIIPNKKDDEDMLSPPFSLSLALNRLVRSPILPPPNFDIKIAPTFVGA